MGDVKIFVSHRIDIDSEIINNSMYIPVRCGAVFDKNKQATIVGDDTGDNISEKRMSFCEFTVQYWAWKNYDADFYGLCHYRRYLSFAEKQFKTDDFNMVYVPILTNRYVRKYVINNKINVGELIRKYDVVVSEYAKVERIPTPTGRQAKTVRNLWDLHDEVFLKKSTIDLMLELIETQYPEYLNSAKEYLAGGLHRGFNCFVMRKELFERMCQLQFDLMFEIEQRLDTTGYTDTMKRTPAFIGEILYGIYIFHLEKEGRHRINKRQLVFLNRTDKCKDSFDFFKFVAWSYIDIALRFIIDPIMPKGSKRRELAKKVFYGIFPIEPKGIANPKKE